MDGQSVRADIGAGAVLLTDVDNSAIAFPPTAGVFYPFPLSPKIAAVSTSGRFDVVALKAPMLQHGKLADIKTPGLPRPSVALENVTAGAPA